MVKGGYYGIKQVYDKAGKPIANNQTITENWSTGATTRPDPRNQRDQGDRSDLRRRMVDNPSIKQRLPRISTHSG